jgi:hypothetical protein
VEVIEGICEAGVRRQLGVWVLEQHAGEPAPPCASCPSRNELSDWPKSTESTALASRCFSPSI